MHHYLKLLLICTIGFFSNFQPSEPYLTAYLKETKGLTHHELNTYVWPVDTYASFALLIPVGLLAEMIGYRKVIFLGLVCREATRVLLIWGDSLWFMSLMQMTYAAGAAVNVVYFSYIYISFDKGMYQKATGWIHASYYIGNLLGSLFGEFLVDFYGISYVVLFYISFGATTIGVLFFFLMPKPVQEVPDSLVRVMLRNGVRSAMKEVRDMYKEYNTMMWSLWWFIGYGLVKMIENYYQYQFISLAPKGNFGNIQAVMDVFKAIAGFLPLLIVGSLYTFNTVYIGIVSFLMMFAYYLTTVWLNIYVSYACNIFIMTCYAFLYAAASSSIADGSRSTRYALVFTTNTFIALALGTVLQVIGTIFEFETNHYYLVCAVGQAVLVSIMLIITPFKKMFLSRERFELISNVDIQ